MKIDATRVQNYHTLHSFIAKAIVCLCLLLCYEAKAQIVTTYAGTGTMGYSGDGGPAKQAQMIAPFGLAFDKAGNLYVVDDGNNAIRKIDAVTKVMTTIVGGGNNYDNCPLKDAALNHPRGIAIDKDDNLYIADASTYIRKADMAKQTITTIAGTRGVTSYYGVGMGNGGLALNAHFDGIAGMAVDAGGNLFVADMLNRCIRRIDAKTQIVTMYAGERFGEDVPTVEMSINQVLDVAVDREGNVYIPDQGMIRKIDVATHEVITLAGKMHQGEYSGDGGPATDATLSPIGVAVDNDHNVYIADWGNQRIRKIDNRTGIITTIAGNGTLGYSGDCGPAQEASLNWPWAIKTDSNGEVFFTELRNYTVRTLRDDKPNVITGTIALCLHDFVALQNEAPGGVWSSSNTNIATVDNNGIVRSVAAGAATIKYTADMEGCSTTVSDHTIHVKAVDESGAIKSSQYTCIGSDVLPNGTAGNGFWISSDSAVAYVNSSGYIAGLQAGTAELKYRVQDKCAITDNVSVQVFRPQKLFIGNDTSFCKSDPLVIDAGSQFVSYKWNTGAFSQSVAVDAPGIYWVVATDGNQCTSTDSISINQVFDNPVLNWQHISTLCQGSSMLLTTPPDAVAVVWQDSSSAKSFSITRPGTYWVTVTDEHQCVGSDTLVIDKEVALPRGFLPADTSICAYNKLILNPAVPFTTYKWSTGSTAPSLTIENPGLYSLEVQDQYKCTGVDSILISKKTCDNRIYFPNAFTPNNDGVNDFFKPAVFGSLLQFTMVVYNRWGKKVFATTDGQHGWDGKASALIQDAGTYIWYATYQLSNDNKRSEKGVVMLVR